VTGLDQDSNSFPNAWKMSLMFYVIGICVMSLTIIASLLGNAFLFKVTEHLHEFFNYLFSFEGCCVRSICRKSIFTISGTIQAVAGNYTVNNLQFIQFSQNSKMFEQKFKNQLKQSRFDNRSILHSWNILLPIW